MLARDFNHFENHVVGVNAVSQVVNWKTDNYGAFLQSNVKLGRHGLFGGN